MIERIKLDALPVPLAAWIVWTKDEKDEDALTRYQSLFHVLPTHFVEHQDKLWAGPLPEEV